MHLKPPYNLSRLGHQDSRQVGTKKLYMKLCLLTALDVRNRGNDKTCKYQGGCDKEVQKVMKILKPKEWTKLDQELAQVPKIEPKGKEKVRKVESTTKVLKGQPCDNVAWVTKMMHADKESFDEVDKRGVPI